MNLTIQIKRKAIELGFDIAGVTDASPIEAVHIDFMTEWLKAGCAGQMSYLCRNFEKRVDPSRLLDGAKSVISVGLNYAQPASTAGGEDSGRVVSYARYEDYHPFIRKQLYELVDFMKSVVREEWRFKVCVDSAPIAERSIAVRAGLGFIGRNHMLINPGLGCRILLGEIVTTLAIEADEPFVGDCGECDKCIRACPTGALQCDGNLDASRCINYLTIEHKGEIARELACKIGGRLFGCEECILVCPYQKSAPSCSNRQFRLYPDREKIDPNEILSMDEESFAARFAGSAIGHTGLDSLKRNARICLANIREGHI